MRKKIPLYLYGSLIIFAGIFILMSENSTFMIKKNTLGITLIAGAIFAFLTAYFRQGKHIQFAYHELHALAILVYGLSILLFCNTIEKLISFTAFLFIFYTFSEIVFGLWLFNLAQQVIIKILVIRVVLGLVIGILTIVSMRDSEYTLLGFGVVFIMIGINVLLYEPVMKSNNRNIINN